MSLITEVSLSLRNFELSETADLLQNYQLNDLSYEDPFNPVPFAKFTINKFESFQFYAGKISVSNSDNLPFWLEFAGKLAHAHQGIIEITWNNVVFEVECHHDAKNLTRHVHNLLSKFMDKHCREVEVEGNVYFIYMPSEDQNPEDIIFSYSFCRTLDKVFLAYGNMINEQCIVSDVGLEVESANEIIAKLKENNFEPLRKSQVSSILR